MERIRIKIAGQSGAGLLSSGEIVMKALKDMGYFVVANREYPSVIKGGHSSFTINIDDEPIYGLAEKVDVMMSIDWQGLENFVGSLKDGGTLIHGLERTLGVKEVLEKTEGRGVEMIHRDARTAVEELGGNVLMVNVYLIGMLWKILGFDYEFVEKQVTEKFKSKPKLLEIDLKCLKAGYEAVEKKMDIPVPGEKPETIILDGNKALALGAIHCGVRAYYAYPMSPSSTILSYMAMYAEKTGVLVKQVEDEISVANMTLGSMHMGTRALCSTSGGGYDLMTETVSLSGIIETPFVVVDVQRPGPATGLPTWTGQGDYNLAVYSSHGEFPRIVIAASDNADVFDLIQHAFNYAEKFQCMVVFLSEQVIAKTQTTIPPYEEGKIEIERGLVPESELSELKNEDRYEITESGLSKRWLPGQSEAYYFANSDEHLEDGGLTEDAEPAAAMYEKRMRKMNLIEEALPEPETYGEATPSAGAAGAEISFVGWGSSRCIMRDIVKIYQEKGVKVNYLHFSFVFPLKTETLRKFFEENENVHLIEGNYLGQFGNMVEAEGEVKFAGRLLKWNGRAFFIEEVSEYIDNNLKK